MAHVTTPGTHAGRSSPSATPSTCSSTTANANSASPTSCATSPHWASARVRPGAWDASSAACFATLNAPGRDPGDLTALAAELKPTRERIHDLLSTGARSRDPRAKRFCAGLLAHEQALWTFTRVPGVRATNNASERALRHAVLWRKTSYGTQTSHGDRLVERLLTTRETSRIQGRRLHECLTAAITADIHGQPIPALLAPP